MTDRENDFNRTAKDSEGRKVQQELERQLRELGDTMSDSFRHGFEGRGEEIGDRVWDVGRAAVNAAGYGISEAGRAFQAGKQEYQKRAEEARSSASASGMTDWARNFFAKKPEPTAIENIRTSAKKRHSAGAVSYTHLDVYKRQEWGWATGWMYWTTQGRCTGPARCPFAAVQGLSLIHI